MLIGAESKGGKSTFIAGLIRQLITGGDVLGFKVSRPLKVLYLQAELRENRLKERLFPTYSKISDESKKNLYIWSTKGVVLFNEHSEEISAEIFDLSPDVLIIDPMLNFHNYNENNAQEMAQFFRTLDTMKENFDIAIIMAHHFRKSSQDPKAKSSLLDSIRGSSALRGWAVTTIAMEGRGDSEYRELAFDLRNSDNVIKRTIKYNKSTKDFDWHDPIGIISNAIQKTMSGKKLSAGDFLNHILGHHGELLSHNRTKASIIKRHLLEYHYIKEERKGKTRYVSLVKNDD